MNKKLNLKYDIPKNPVTVVIGDIEIGKNKEPVIIAGPCAVESENQILQIALQVKNNGAQILRGGAFKPRTSPYSFQGLGEEGLKYLQIAGNKTNMPIISEITATSNLKLVNTYVDILQIGSRNMQNYDLLKSIGKNTPNTPVLLKRGMSATKDEFLFAAEYLRHHGHNNQIILCERGIRSSVCNGYSRNILDLNLVSDLKNSTMYPVIVDPSHATGRPDLIKDLSLAGIVAGANGLIIESHTNPSKALCDAKQQILPKNLGSIACKVKNLYAVMSELNCVELNC